MPQKSFQLWTHLTYVQLRSSYQLKNISSFPIKIKMHMHMHIDGKSIWTNGANFSGPRISTETENKNSSHLFKAAGAGISRGLTLLTDTLRCDDVPTDSFKGLRVFLKTKRDFFKSLVKKRRFLNVADVCARVRRIWSSEREGIRSGPGHGDSNRSHSHTYLFCPCVGNIFPKKS